ncbi:MAG: NAD(P)(+) transhydrogenase (Re/Si-specific) subunit beta, partial [Bacteroidota bacterium]
MLTIIIEIAYLVGALAFVLGLRQLSSPDTAARGNRLAAIGMGIAIVAALVTPAAGPVSNLAWVAGAL